jgi:ABC-type nitrate/sulfonate/bicarbonate transport system substrate-binding protein
MACGGGASPSPSPAASPSPGASQAPASPSPSPGALPTPEKADLNIGLSVTEPSQFAGMLAFMEGVYEKHGLNVSEPTVFEGDARVAQALQAGQIDIGFSGTSSAVSSQLTDVPYVVTGVLAVILTDDLVCRAEITDAATIVAKPSTGEKATIAISTFGGTSNAAALLALKALELAPTDGVITQVGGQSARIAALQGGSVDCAIVDQNLRQDMLDQGFSIVVQLKDAAIEFGRSGMSMTREFLDANPNTALVATASVLEAQNLIWTDTQTAADNYAEFAQFEPDQALQLMEDFMEIGNRDLYATEQAFVNPQKAIAVINPDIIDVDVNNAFDMSFLETLAANGFYDVIGSPLPPSS